MSDIKHSNRYTGLDRRAREAGILKPAVTVPFKTGGRHAAITTNLYNFHSYKTWADKVRGSWEDKK